MRDLVRAVWSVFTSGTRVTSAEFLQTDGLADAIVAGLNPNIFSRIS